MAFLRIQAKGLKSIDALDMHLDADTLAAFTEHVLSVGDEAAVFAHLAECGTCRDCLAVNAELKDFHWSARKRQGHSLLGTLYISRSIKAAAGIACAGALWLLLSLQVSRTDLVSTSRVPGDGLRITRSVNRPILKSWRTQSAATTDFTPHMPQKITAGWGKVPLRRLATGDFLAARNSHRFLKEVTLATVSFGAAGTIGDADNGTAALNQIVLKTKFGERWITVEGFWEGPNEPGPQ
jgi:hypothetical protein